VLAGPAVALTERLLGPKAHVDLVHVLEGSEILIEPGLPAGFHEAVKRTRDKLIERFDRFVSPLRAAGVETSVVVETGDPSFSILCRAEATQSDLMVIGRKTLHNGTGLLSTPAYRMVKHAPVPVLVVPTRVAA
jgi:nucleotide-binding universal stress UspA family protein